MLPPRTVRGIGVHGRAPVVDGSRPQLVVPGLVAVDLAQAVRGAVLGQPLCGIGAADVDRMSGYVGRRLGGGDPSRGFLFRAVLQDRLPEEPLLVRGGTPAAVDEEHDPVIRGNRGCLAQGAEERRVERGNSWNLVVEDRRAIGDGAAIRAERITALPRRATLRAARGADR